MGIENEIPVEESTEPPIRGLTNATHSHPPGAVAIQERTNTATSVASSTAAGTVTDPEKTVVLPSSANEPHTIPISQVERLYNTNIKHGLSSSEAARRLEHDGPNKVEGAKGVSLWKILVRQVSNALTMVLFLVMALSFAIQDFIEGSVIAAVILLNIIVGFVQDFRAEQTIQSLFALSAPTCKVVRSEQIETIKAENLVKGDVVLLNVGDIVPADLRLVDGLNMSTDEALLTGESLPISKHSDIVLDHADVPIGDRINMLYSASTITRGRGTGIVTATAMDTEVGKIAEMLRASPKMDENETTMQRLMKRFKANLRSILGLEGTPLQVKLSKFALMLFALAILLCLIVFAVSKFHVQDEVLIYGICVGVAVIPESLIAVLTISMAVGTKAMAKGNVIVRKLSALEAVGGVTNICSDKTGTLTQGKMITRKIWIPNGPAATVEGCTNPFDPTSGTVSWEGEETEAGSSNIAVVSSISRLPVTARKFIQCLSLCNNATVSDGKPSSSSTADDTAETSTISSTMLGSNAKWTAVGEPTEIALHVFAMRFGMSKLTVTQSGDLSLVAEHPFDSSCKRMSVVYSSPGTTKVDVYTKGALEALLPLLDVSEEIKAQYTEQAETLASQGLRVLCIAHKSVEAAESLKETREAAESSLTPLGLAGLYDPPRLETAGAVAKCKRAGIKVHMLTGDHIKTATAIAHEVGIIPSPSTMTTIEASTAIMPASHFDSLSDSEIDALPSLPLVLARCSPTTKVRMVSAMHRRSFFCVMTGDGVNDSPALKTSDVGIAMGLAGSDVAKEAASMVLTDDNFTSIVVAVEEGRRLFDNIQKFLLHLLVSNIAQVLLLLIGLSFRDADNHSVFPLSPIEILWANLITSSFLALGLGLEPPQPDIMLRGPHSLKTGVFTKEIILDKCAYGFFMGGLCIASFASVIYGPSSGSGSDDSRLGHDCNTSYNPSCQPVYRARATTYATLSFLLLVTAWEVKHFTRSLFAMFPERSTRNKYYSGPLAIFPTVWENRFLFFAVVAGFLTTFPVVYIPVINRVVFKHESITWEWGVVAACVVVYVALVESWKAGKRALGKGVVVYGDGDASSSSAAAADPAPAPASSSTATTMGERREGEGQAV